MFKYSTNNVKFNVLVNVLDGSFFGAALGFASFVTVIPLFVSQLTDSAILIGLIPAIHTVGWQLPQLLTASRVSQLSLIKPMVIFMTIHERLPFLVLALLAWFSPGLSARWVLIITFILLVWQGFGGGLTATAWQSMIAKIMPLKFLGSFYGLQAAAGNLFASIGAVLAGWLLQVNQHPLDFTLCFLLAGICMLLSLVFLGFTREEPVSYGKSTLPKGQFWRQLGSILKSDSSFRWFIVARMATQFSMMGFAFYTVYAVREFDVPEFVIGLYTGLLMIVQTTSNPVLGWLGDRTGHLRAFQLGVVASAASTCLAWLASGSNWFFPIFLLAGIANAAAWTTPMAMTIEYGKETDRPAYIGLANTLVAPITFIAPILGGWLADSASYPTTFLVSSIAGLLSLLILLVFVKDPRKTPSIQTVQTITD